MAFRAGIDSKKNSATRTQVTREISEKEVPFIDPPDITTLDIDIKSSGKRGNQIEFATKVGQRFERKNRVDDAFDLKQLNEIGKDRRFANVQPQTAVAKSLANKQKESATAANIENCLWRRTVELQVLRSLNVHF